MSYTELRELYYADSAEYAAAYPARYNSPYAHHIAFKIGENPAFFILTPEMHETMMAIQKADKRVFAICSKLPGKAIEQFTLRCLIDEITLTNNIEGVHSTRREIDGILSALGRTDRRLRFYGLVQKYVMLQTKGDLPLKSCRDIRDIYDDLVHREVVEDNGENAPDGVLFRKGAVSVLSATQKEIHRGLYPESAITAAMEQALAYLNNEEEDLLLRAAVFHYLLGYIHPFYDGNGRLNRFISSYLLSKEYEPVLGYRLSYTIRENISGYYSAFKKGNDPLNKGDLTPFVLMFLDIVKTSALLLEEALSSRLKQLDHYTKHIHRLPDAQDNVCGALYDLLIQAELFSEHGISTVELLSYLRVSRGTLRTKLLRIDAAGFLKSEQVKHEKFYGIDLTKVDQFINTLSPA